MEKSSGTESQLQIGSGNYFLIAKGEKIYQLSLTFEKFSGGEFDVPPERIFSEVLDLFIVN